MSNEMIDRVRRIRPALERRARIFSSVRSFFVGRGFLEVDTPVRIYAPAPEPHIDAIPAEGQYLRTSPELQMKCMLAAGYGRIFQIGSCFRQGEIGRLHREEFAMLEWYEAGAGYMDLARFAKEMIVKVSSEVNGSARITFRGKEIDLAGEWYEISVDDAFRQFAGVAVADAIATNEYERLLVDKVEPALPADRPCILRDYPAALASLARLKPENPAFSERWELYVGGVEIANTYGELVDAAEQKRRFEQDTDRRASARKLVYPVDKTFQAALDLGIPAASGSALGLDRLVMVLTGSDSLDEVRY